MCLSIGRFSLVFFIIKYVSFFFHLKVVEIKEHTEEQCERERKNGHHINVMQTRERERTTVKRRTKKRGAQPIRLMNMERENSHTEEIRTLVFSYTQLTKAVIILWCRQRSKCFLCCNESLNMTECECKC